MGSTHTSTHDNIDNQGNTDVHQKNYVAIVQEVNAKIENQPEKYSYNTFLNNTLNLGKFTRAFVKTELNGKVLMDIVPAILEDTTFFVDKGCFAEVPQEISKNSYDYELKGDTYIVYPIEKSDTIVSINKVKVRKYIKDITEYNEFINSVDSNDLLDISKLLINKDAVILNNINDIVQLTESLPVHESEKLVKAVINITTYVLAEYLKQYIYNNTIITIKDYGTEVVNAITSFSDFTYFKILLLPMLYAQNLFERIIANSGSDIDYKIIKANDVELNELKDIAVSLYLTLKSTIYYHCGKDCDRVNKHYIRQVMESIFIKDKNFDKLITILVLEENREIIEYLRLELWNDAEGAEEVLVEILTDYIDYIKSESNIIRDSEELFGQELKNRNGIISDFIRQIDSNIHEFTHENISITDKIKQNSYLNTNSKKNTSDDERNYDNGRRISVYSKDLSGKDINYAYSFSYPNYSLMININSINSNIYTDNDIENALNKGDIELVDINTNNFVKKIWDKTLKFMVDNAFLELKNDRVKDRVSSPEDIVFFSVDSNNITTIDKLRSKLLSINYNLIQDLGIEVVDEFSDNNSDKKISEHLTNTIIKMRYYRNNMTISSKVDVELIFKTYTQGNNQIILSCAINVKSAAYNGMNVSWN